jgi:hypothetical protein
MLSNAITNEQDDISTPSSTTEVAKSRLVRLVFRPFKISSILVGLCNQSSSFAGSFSLLLNNFM